MNELDLLVQTIANGERLGGQYDYTKLCWRKMPVTIVGFLKDGK